MTDTDGRLLAVEVHAADIQDRDGAKGVQKRSRASFPFVETGFAASQRMRAFACRPTDGGYAGRLIKWRLYT